MYQNIKQVPNLLSFIFYSIIQDTSTFSLPRKLLHFFLFLLLLLCRHVRTTSYHNLHNVNWKQLDLPYQNWWHFLKQNKNFLMILFSKKRKMYVLYIITNKHICLFILWNYIVNIISCHSNIFVAEYLYPSCIFSMFCCK